MKSLLYLLLLILSLFLLCRSQSIANSSNPTSLFVFAHSHLEYGGKYTFSEYYNGTVGRGCTNCIYTSIFSSLLKQWEPRFLVESVGFLKLWAEDSRNVMNSNWLNQANFMGQFEIANGGIVVNDEACTYYELIIDQHSLGQHWINQRGLPIPKVAWSLSSLGHSKTHAWILAKMGYNALFIEKIHPKAIHERKRSKTMNFLWKPSDRFEETLFTEVADYPYPSDSIFWNGLSYAEFLHERKKYYLTNNLQHHCGDDFSWTSSNFKKIRKLIDHLKTLQVEPSWGSFSKYIHKVNNDYVENGYVGDEPNKTLTVFTDDYFPYITRADEAWTGFYTSKPWLKGLIYDGMRYLMGLKNLGRSCYSKAIRL